MWLDLIGYIFLGFSITATPGAVFFETVRRTLSEKDSLIKFQLGNFTGMTLIISSVFLGFAGIISNPLIANIFYILCGSILIILGISALLDKSSYEIKGKKSRYSAYVTGILLSVLNPLGVVFWIALVGKIVQETNNMMYAAMNIFGAVAGAAMLFVVLVILISIFRLKITPRFLILLSRVFGFVILIYGVLSFSQVTL